MASDSPRIRSSTDISHWTRWAQGTCRHLKIWVRTNRRNTVEWVGCQTISTKGQHVDDCHSLLRLPHGATWRIAIPRSAVNVGISLMQDWGASHAARRSPAGTMLESPG